MDVLCSQLEILKQKKKSNNVIIEGTVPTGLEILALKEIITRNIAKQDEVCHVPGRVYFLIEHKDFTTIFTLRSIDNLNLVVDITPNLNFVGIKIIDLCEIVNVLNNIDLLAAVSTWALLTNYQGIINPTENQHAEAKLKQKDYTHNILKFRVTCDRIGKDHSFSSNDAACEFGGEVNNKFYWVVALSDWDLNILLRINDADVMVCLKITVKSLHHRSLVEFGRTTLRPTIAYGMLALAQLKQGEHIVDPLCGSGSIPIECIYAFPNVIISCGDIHEKDVNRTFKNFAVHRKQLKMPDIFHWDSKYLPFKNNTVDAIVTDLPYGRRSGNIRDNADLYVKLLIEFSRVLKPKTGRVVLLTRDASNIYKALEYKKSTSRWHITQIIMVNVGALKCTLIVANLKS